MGAVEAGKVHDKAAQIAATALNLVAEYAPAFRGVTPAVLDGEAPAEAALAGVPNWEALFGSGDYCECEHCRSVYGPAAYLVDVLDFLAARQANPPATTTAKEILFRRRADLGEIELTCENTNTPVPYVDLVNELLENAVSATAIPARQRQTTGTAAELAANPQHVNAGAYAKLKDAVFPWDLPFDLLAGRMPDLPGSSRAAAPTAHGNLAEGVALRCRPRGRTAGLLRGGTQDRGA